MLGNDQSWSSKNFWYVSDFGCGFINQFWVPVFWTKKKILGFEKIKK
jgi:hypothetical protein